MHSGAECFLQWDTMLEMSAQVLISCKALVHNTSSVSRPYCLKFSIEDAIKVTSNFPVRTWYLTDVFKSSIITCYPGHSLLEPLTNWTTASACWPGVLKMHCLYRHNMQIPSKWCVVQAANAHSRSNLLYCPMAEIKKMLGSLFPILLETMEEE